MGEINDKFADAFRDFVTAGVPASGAHDPQKPDIRSIALPIEAGIAAAALSGTDLVAARELLNPLVATAQAAQAAAEDTYRASEQLFSRVGDEVESRVAGAISEATFRAERAGDLASSASLQAIAAADVAGAAATAFFPTYAALVAALPANGTVVRVWRDEKNSGQYSEYRIESGAPVLKLTLLRDSAVGTTGVIFSSFRADNELQALDLFYSSDGYNLIRLNGDFVDNPGEMRDPSLFQADDGYWYYFRTVGYRSYSFEVRRSNEKNLVNGFRSVAFVDCRTTARPNIVTAWAPSAFRHPVTGVWYAEVSLADASDETSHSMAYVEFTATDFTAWKPPVSYGMGANYIDGETHFENGLFHMFVKNEGDSAKYIERWTSPSYPNSGGWTKANSGDWLGFSITGTTVEGVTLAKINGLWFLYADANSIGKPFVATAPALVGPWTTPVEVNTYGAPMRHFYAFALNTRESKAQLSEAASVLTLGKVALLAPTARAATPLNSLIKNGWSASFPTFGDATPSGYGALSGEVTRSSAPSTPEQAVILSLPSALANANPKRFVCAAANGTAVAYILIYKGDVVWQSGSTDRIDLGPIMYPLAGKVSGLNPG